MATSTQWQLAQEAAEQYENVLVPTILGPAAQTLVDWTELTAGETVLDVGCGTGAAARFAAEKVGAGGQVTGVDVNPGMIAVAKSLPPSNDAVVDWQEASAYELPAADDSRDVILCAQSLQFLPDRPAALAEMHRVLKPGGRAAISLWSSLPESPYFHALVNAVREHIGPDTAGGLGAAFSLSNADEIQTLLDQAGFKNIKMTAMPLALDLPRPETFVPAHILATPMAVGYQAASPAARTALVQDVTRALARYKNGAGLRVPFTTHLVLAGR